MGRRAREDGDAVISKHLEVTPRSGESTERMIKRFTKKVRNDGILQEVYDRRFYDKPSVRKRKKHINALYNAKNEK